MKMNWLQRLNLWLLFPLCLMGLIVTLALWFWLSLPNVNKLRSCIVTAMHQIKLCPDNPDYLTLDQISPIAIRAILVSEDAGFFQHQGFDWHEIRLTLEASLREQRYSRGASTISQQLAKNVFLNHDRNLYRKLREALITRQIEKNFSKQEILEFYLNVIELGPEIYGLKQAAQYYFNKPALHLNALEASYLAYLLPSPIRYHNRTFATKELTPFAHQRLQISLNRLLAYGDLSESEHAYYERHLDFFPWTHFTVLYLDDHFSLETSNAEVHQKDSKDEQKTYVEEGH